MNEEGKGKIQGNRGQPRHRRKSNQTPPFQTPKLYPGNFHDSNASSLGSRYLVSLIRDAEL